MTLGRYFFWIAMGLFVTEPAYACRGVFSHRYVLLETPPSRLPPTAVLLEVMVPEDAFSDFGSPGWSVTARITGGMGKRLIGKPVKIQRDIISSCDRGTESSKAKYVVGFLVEKRGKLTLAPVTYRSKEYRSEPEDRSEGIRPPPQKDAK